MTKEQFFDWISGYFDISEPVMIGAVETRIIKDHIDLVRGVEKPPPIIAEDNSSETKEYDCFEDDEFINSIPERMKSLHSERVYC